MFLRSFFALSSDPRELPVLSHSFPIRRSSDLLDCAASRSRHRFDVGVALLDAVAFAAIPGVARAERGTELLVEVVGALRIQRTVQVGGLELLFEHTAQNAA